MHWPVARRKHPRLSDPTSRDAVVLRTLTLRSCTTPVTGAGNPTGVAFSEIYEVPLSTHRPPAPEIDFHLPADSFSSVSAPRNRFLSLLLVAFWFLATQHCVLEAAELFHDHATSTATGCCSAQADGCEADGCKAVEDGQYRADAKIVKIAAPDLSVHACLLCAQHLLAPHDPGTSLIAKERGHAAPDWVPSWQFERRAAAPAHAPDSLIA